MSGAKIVSRYQCAVQVVRGAGVYVGSDVEDSEF